jgi:serine/threonine protein kinase
VACPDTYRVGQTVAIRKWPFTIGRAQCDLTIGEAMISRRHASISWNGSRFAILDLGSSNGTYVNGRQVSGEEPLPLNAEIWLSGDTRLRFRCDLPELPDFTGQKVADRYRLEKCLRAGRKSALYEGTDNRPVRKVAVKLLSPTLARYPGYLEAFEREAQTASEIDHPNICKIYEHGKALLEFRKGSTKAVHYVCMQMLDGGSLTDRLDSPDHATAEAVAGWVGVVADALQHAHRNGVVHAGLKPTSVVFSAQNVPYVTDFAIAARAGAPGRGGPMFGAPEYLAPEQWEGADAAPASDQYSLACLCYRTLAGAVPYENQLDPKTREQNFAHGAARCDEQARRRGRATVGAATAEVVAKAMATRPGDRYGTIAEFAQAFRRSLGAAAPDRQPRVFVSYRREADAGWAALIANRLAGQHGIDVFIDRHRVDSASQIPEKIQTAIRDCDFFVCLLARTTLESGWVREEIRLANAAGKPMIPVIHEGFRRPVDRHMPQWLQGLLPQSWRYPPGAKKLLNAEEVRLFADFDEAAIDKLAKMIRSGRRKG